MHRQWVVTVEEMEPVGSLTLSGSVMKCTAIGRPLFGVSFAFPYYSSALQCTYVLSLACFKLSRNFKPMSVVDSAVSPPELCMHGRHRQRGVSHCSYLLGPSYWLHRRGVWCSRGGHSVVCSAARRSTPDGSVAPSSKCATRIAPNTACTVPTHRQRCSHHSCASLGRARTGAF